MTSPTIDGIVEKFCLILNEDLDNNVLNTPEVQESVRIAARHRDALMNTLTDDQKQLFQTYEKHLSDSIWQSKLALFSYALSMGGSMAKDIVSHTEHA